MRRLVLIVVLTTLVVGAAAAGATRLPGVKTPSRNIRCFVWWPTRTGDLFCTIKRASYVDRLQLGCIDGPSGLDWRGFTLPTNGRAQVYCAGGLMHDPMDTPKLVLLGYGKTWHDRRYACTLEQDGLTCNSTHGHGLFISRQSWRVW